MIKKILISIMVLFCSSLLFGDLAMNDFFVVIQGEKIELGDPIGKIFKIFGKTTYKLRPYTSMTYREYDYQDIIILTSAHSPSETEDNHIWGMSLISNKYSVIKNLRVGDSLSDVIDRLGKPEPDDEDKNSLCYYNHEYDTLLLRINFDDNKKIKEIILVIGP